MVDRDAIIAKVDSQLSEEVKPTVETPTEDVKASEATSTDEAVVQDATAKPDPEEKTSPKDWWDTKNDAPEIAGRIKSIQREYNKKAELASKSEREIQSYKAQLEEVARDVREALQNPEKYKEWRRQLGFKDEITEVRNDSLKPKFSLKGIETPEQLEGAIANALEERDRYWESKLQQGVSRAESTAESKFQQVAEPIAKERWKTALEGMSSEYGEKWSEVQTEVVNLVANGPYKALFNKGGIDEKAILDKVFKAEFTDKYTEHILEKKAKNAETKRKAATEVPKKASQAGLPTGKSKDDIIARVNAKFGSK